MRREILKSNYGTLTLHELIGKGSYGQIYKAYASLQNKFYAVKIISSESEPETLINIEREIQIMLACKHENVVKCHSVELTEDGVWIVMDYHSRGSLADIMAREKRSFQEDEIQSIMGQIVDALGYLHQNKIIHRDIKAANILVSDEGQIKVADFGVSTLLSHTHAGKNTRIGSPLWMSPELLSNSNYTFKTDIWSLGITALELAEGVPPYSHQHPYRAIFSIQSNPPQSLSNPSKWSSQFNNFVSKCLTLDEKKRPSAFELKKLDFIESRKLSNVELAVNTDPSNRGSLRISKNENELEPRVSSCGTMILHEVNESCEWGRNTSSSLINNGSINTHGTFVIKTEPIMEETLFEEITKSFPKEDQNNKENKSKKSNKKTTESLYLEMEEEISKIRKKYLQQIRSIEEKETLTFEQILKKDKFLQFKS